MKLKPRQYAEALYQAINEVPPKNVDSVITHFVALLAKQGMISRVPQIIREFEKYSNQLSGIILAEAISAQPLTDTLRQAIIASLKEQTGLTIELRERVEAGILGGVIVRFDDKILDASLRTQLQNLQKQLTF